MRFRSHLACLVVVARVAGPCGGLAASGTPPASALRLRDFGIVCFLARLGGRECRRRTLATRAQRPGRQRPTAAPATLHARQKPPPFRAAIQSSMVSRYPTRMLGDRSGAVANRWPSRNPSFTPPQRVRSSSATRAGDRPSPVRTSPGTSSSDRRRWCLIASPVRTRTTSDRLRRGSGFVSRLPPLRPRYFFLVCLPAQSRANW